MGRREDRNFEKTPKLRIGLSVPEELTSTSPMDLFLVVLYLDLSRWELMRELQAQAPFLVHPMSQFGIRSQE